MKQVKQTIKFLRRSPYQALAATLAMSLTFFVSSIFVTILISLFIQYIIHNIIINKYIIVILNFFPRNNFNEFFGDFEEETRGVHVDVFAVPFPLAGHRKDKMLFGAGHGNVHEAPLFFETSF